MKHAFIKCYRKKNATTKNVSFACLSTINDKMLTKHSMISRTKNTTLYFLLALFGFASLFTSCKEEWNEHYNAAPSTKSDLNLFDYIKSRSELSVFTQMLEISGYDSILSKSQTFTVWAPVNQSLAGVNLNNMDEVTKIVTNHVTRFSHPTADIVRESKDYRMMNNKILDFGKNQNKFIFGDKEILESDIAVANGILHIMTEYVPYRRNFWEFINEQEGLDSLRNYLNSLNARTFDEEKSFVDGIFVDSVFKQTNLVLDYLADLKSEDSTYTAILPDNDAWNEAFGKAKSYFKTLPKYGGELAQNRQAKLTIVLDLFFRGNLETPLTTDTITSTNRTKFGNPDRLFEGATLTKLSNGYAYVTNQIKSKITETWLKPIKIEAEYASYRTFANFSLSVMPSIGTGFDISRGYYLFANPTTTSDLSSINNMFVKFGLPSTYSGKYNIYCVTVPAIIVNPNDLKPNKLRFFLSFLNDAGTQLNDQPVNINNDVILSNANEPQKIPLANMFTTDPTQVNKMLAVKDFQFHYADLYGDLSTGYTPSVYLRVNNAARTAEILTYSRTLRIDCIILEPVVE